MEKRLFPQRSSDLVHATLDDWVLHEAIPFSINSFEVFNASIDKVIASLSDSVQLHGFGEALHGGEDILILRNRLFQCLVKTHGYSAIAIERSSLRAHAVNEYLAGRGLASYEAVQDTGFSHDFGRLDANRELVKWIRAFNADPSNSVKLQFNGFDSPTEMTGSYSLAQVLHFVLDNLRLD
jgi:erythromycin esterase